jgi:hypothetical protein
MLTGIGFESVWAVFSAPMVYTLLAQFLPWTSNPDNRRPTPQANGIVHC